MDSVSLCPWCNCMTKTVEHKCGKCGGTKACLCERGELCEVGCELLSKAEFPMFDDAKYELYCAHIRDCKICKELLEREDTDPSLVGLKKRKA